MLDKFILELREIVKEYTVSWNLTLTQEEDVREWYFVAPLTQLINIDTILEVRELVADLVVKDERYYLYDMFIASNLVIKLFEKNAIIQTKETSKQTCEGCPEGVCTPTTRD